MDSCLAGSMKLQVLTTMTSASPGCGVSSWPCAVSWPIITSVSTRFFGHPRLTKPIFTDYVFLNMTICQAAFFQILLMIVFRRPECGRRLQLGDDGAREAALRGVARGLRFGFLLRRMKENRGAVLRPDIRPLAIQSGGVVVVPEDLQQIVVADHRRIVGHLHHFGVAGAIRADLFISRVIELTARVADLRRLHAGQAAERGL